MDFSKPLLLLDCYLAELEWRFDLLFNLIWEIYNELRDIKEVLEYDASPRPPFEFNPLDTTLVTEVQPPVLQPTSPPQETMMLSAGELIIMFQTGSFTHQIAQAFDDDSTASMTL